MDPGFPDDSGVWFGYHAVVGIPQYYMVVKYDLKGYADQSALSYKQQTLVYASIEAVYGYIVIKFKNFLVEEGVNDIIVDGPQNFIYAFSDTDGKVHGSNRGKAVINISLGGTSKVYNPNQYKWLSHGIMAGLVWGFLALLDVGADLL